MVWRVPVRTLSRVAVCVDIAARSFPPPLAASARCLSSDAERGSGCSKFRLTVHTINPRVKEMKYAVRGKLPLEARRIERRIKQGKSDYPFNRVLFCNIGDCQAMGQPPLTFVRQLVAACLDPTSLLDSQLYPEDVRERARAILASNRGSLGCYSDSRGIELIRKHVAEFIEQRDNIPCNWKDVYLVNGGSDGIKTLLFMCMTEQKQRGFLDRIKALVCPSHQRKNEKAGVIIPIPQYPLYTATISEMDAHPINYNLDEDHSWSINVSELPQLVRDARKHCQPRVMVVINPGNPTGQNLSHENMRDIIRFCHEEGLLLLSDEVYQENIWEEGVEFQSFRKILHSMGDEYRDFQLVSFNSTSKGYIGECGMRGGYMEMTGFDDKLKEQLYKLSSTKLCPNTPGQVVTDVMVKPPQPGDPSYELFDQERRTILQALKRKAELVYERMNQIPEVCCNRIQGAMYAFPRIDIPEEAWEDAKKENLKNLDTYYCLEFLRQKGVCVVPGSGFGQKEGTWHFRTTILPSEEDLEDMLKQFADFHTGFLRKYGRL